MSYIPWADDTSTVLPGTCARGGVSGGACHAETPLGHGQRWRSPDQSTIDHLFNVLIEYVRQNLYDEGGRHYGRALIALVWLKEEPHWAGYDGQTYATNLLMEVRAIE
jgi:hypothetical protein